MIDSGDTAFVLIAPSMMLLMIPGPAFFYGGVVRRKDEIIGMDMTQYKEQAYAIID